MKKLTLLLSSVMLLLSCSHLRDGDCGTSVTGETYSVADCEDRARDAEEKAEHERQAALENWERAHPFRACVAREAQTPSAGGSLIGRSGWGPLRGTFGFNGGRSTEDAIKLCKTLFPDDPEAQE